MLKHFNKLHQKETKTTNNQHVKNVFALNILLKKS